MTTLSDWYKAFNEAAAWKPHPIILTKLVWDELYDRLDIARFCYREGPGLIAAIFYLQGGVRVADSRVAVNYHRAFIGSDDPDNVPRFLRHVAKAIDRKLAGRK